MSAPECIPAQVLESNSATRSARGERLVTQLRNFVVDEEADDAGGDLFEEVGAVIAGVFHVSAAGEDYDLSAGEGIIIPPGEPRLWRCTEGPGVLYRVHTRGDRAGGGEAA